MVAGDPERQTHVPVHRPRCEVGEIVLRNTVVIYRNQNIPRISVTGVFVALFFLAHQFSSRAKAL